MRLRVPMTRRFRPTELQMTIFWAGVVGVLGACAAVMFLTVTQAAQERLWGIAGDLVESAASVPGWKRVLVPIAGGLLAGATLQLGRRFARGQPSIDYMEAVLGEGSIRVRPTLVQSSASLLSIATGGSIGREGALVQLSGMLASWLGRHRAFSLPRLRLIVACGSAAGIASAYDSPLTGALFVSEVMLGSIAMESLGPLVFASVMATLTTRQLLAEGPRFHLRTFDLVSPWELVPYAVMGCALGLLAPWFVRLLRGSERLFSATRLPPFLRLALGGAVVGLLALARPEVWGNGAASVNSFLQDDWGWKMLVAVLGAKLLATAATVGSGAVGGVFTPTLFTGAGLGYLAGLPVHHFWPAASAGPSAYALVGMAAFLAGTTHAPLMAIMIVFEMTLDYGTVLPLMLSCVAAYFASTWTGAPSIYARALAIRKGGASWLETRTVRPLVKHDPMHVGVRATFGELVEYFQHHRHNHVYVTNDEGRFLGAIALHDLKPYLNDPNLSRLVIASELLHDDMPVIAQDDSLTAALERFLHVEGERLPVVASADDRRLIGGLTKNDLLLTLADRTART